MTDETQVSHDYDSPKQENPRCTICNTPKHRHQSFRHPFSDPKNPIGPSQIFGKTRVGQTGGSGKGPAMPEAKVKVERSTLPFDPVLRMALISNGVITPEDLTHAEAMMRSAMPMQMIGIDPTQYEGQ